VSIGITDATRQEAHLAVDVISRGYAARIRRLLLTAATLLAVLISLALCALVLDAFEIIFVVVPVLLSQVLVQITGGAVLTLARPAC